jgi:hypothetical protein
MKKFFVVVLSLTLVGGTFLFTGCGKDDITKPVITLTGGATDVVVYKSAATYTDPGYSATDDVDGEITVTVTGTVNMNSAGDYTLTYSATDKAGNVQTVDRTVTVDAAPYIAAYYSVTDVVTGGGTTTYNETISASTVLNNKINFTRFGNYDNGTAYATIAGSTITVPQQDVTCGTPSATRTFSGNGGTFTATQVVISYTEVTNGTTATATGTYVRQ